ncbi:hypothetical protein QAD02_006366 [Eretmocerus hayati]|uniref:Uncharacterized protein n=1 Tax=Eretmocerus hayati TaxID=131215 RepID=A0ACC2N0Q7_9HYME|nr:hypothetical protein QAD02_006366 [Eretmocerus hayati]
MTILQGKARPKKAIDPRIPLRLISTAVDLHDSALELLATIEGIHNIIWFISLGLNVIGTGFAIIIVLEKRDEVFVFIRYSAAFLAAMTHFYVIFLPGQKVLGSSDEMRYNCYDTEWYHSTPEIKKLLIIMMIRSQITNQLTGAGLFVLSMQTYGEVRQLIMSNFAT